MEIDEQQLPAHWREYAERPDIRAALEVIFTAAAAEIAARGPACWASGRCCNFERSGHLLYVTGLETAYTLAHAGTPDHAAIEGARERGGCPFQRANLCGIHHAKPLGCRLYFCDRSSHDWQHTLHERLMNELRSLHDRFGIVYRYGEWRAMLDRFNEKPPGGSSGGS